MTRSTMLTSLCAAAAVSGVGRLRADAADVLRISSLPQDAALEPLYSVSSGVPATLGITVDVQMLANGAAVMSAVVGGTLEVGTSNTMTVLQAREKGIPVVVIAPGVVYSTKQPTSVLMVAKNSPFKAARDLNGKTIAVDGIGNVTQFSVVGWVDQNGGDAKSLHFIEMPFSTMPAALESGRVDAALVAEPNVTLGKDRARIFARAYDSIAPEFQLAVWFTTEAFAASHPDLIKRLQTMVLKTGAWANANQTATAAIVAKSGNLDPAVIATMTRARWAEKVDLSLITPVIAAALRYGAITKSVEARDLFAASLR